MKKLRGERKQDAMQGSRKFCNVAAVAAAAAIGGAVISSNAQGDAADTAAGAQVQSTQMGTAEQRRQFDAVRQLLNPYVNAGTGALNAQQNLIGLNGAGAQQTAITSLQNSPQFTSMLKSGENSILQNASATGSLRGGNTQAALAQFSPQLLAQVIESQYGKLGGLTSIGQNAAAGVGNAGMQTGNAISALLQQQGAAQAGAALANGRAQSQMINGIAGGIGTIAGMGGFGGTSAPSQDLATYGGGFNGTYGSGAGF